MKPTKEEIEKALKALIEAKIKIHRKYAEDKDDLFDSYVHQQILLLYKEFPDLDQHLLRGYELFGQQQA